MSNTEKKVHHQIADWIGDIIALESHVEEAMDRQLKLESADANLSGVIQRFHDTVRDSKHRAETYQEQYGSEPGNPIIKAGGNLLGKAAGMIDIMRADGVAKALRDNYAAYNLLAISYTMLHTTAMAFDDAATQTFAEAGLRTYAGLVQDINHVLPEAVLADLKGDDDLPVRNPIVADQCRQVIQDVWRSNANV